MPAHFIYQTIKELTIKSTPFFEFTRLVRAVYYRVFS